MAHHKRRRPKSSRAGCLFCRPHKHQRAKDSFNSKTVQEKRELQDELPPSPHKSRKKNTRVWCRGKEDQLHDPQWVDKGHWWHYPNRAPRWWSDWQLCCKSCNKKLGRVSPFGQSTRKIRISKFPGWEQFKDGPSSEPVKEIYQCPPSSCRCAFI